MNNAPRMLLRASTILTAEYEPCYDGLGEYVLVLSYFSCAYIHLSLERVSIPPVADIMLYMDNIIYPWIVGIKSNHIDLTTQIMTPELRMHNFELTSFCVNCRALDIIGQ